MNRPTLLGIPAALVCAAAFAFAPRAAGSTPATVPAAPAESAAERKAVLAVV